MVLIVIGYFLVALNAALAYMNTAIFPNNWPFAFINIGAGLFLLVSTILRHMEEAD